MNTAKWAAVAVAIFLNAGCEPCEPDAGQGNIYTCICVVPGPGPVAQEIHENVCTLEGSKQDVCFDACQEHSSIVAQVDGPYGCCDDPTQQDGGGGGGELEPHPSEARVDRSRSFANITHGDQQRTVGVLGEVAFTGGCDRASSCGLTFSEMDLTTDDFSVGEGGEVFVTDVHILTVGDMAVVQSGGTFEIPAERIRVLVNASVNGAPSYTVFTPAVGQDVSGSYDQTSGELALFGVFYASTSESIELELHGVATRPPVANAGPPQSVPPERPAP